MGPVTSIGAKGKTGRIGILGGTFDPPHLGHLILAETAYDVLDLERVLFVPAANPPHKHSLPITDVRHRVAMVQEAIANNPRFAMSQVDITRPGPHYTVDTLGILKEQFPQAELYFVMGGDSLHDMASWHEPGGIITRAKLAVMRRPGAIVDLSGLEAQLPGIAGRVVFVDAPVIGISATMLRERLRSGRSIRYLVPEVVERYISSHDLYEDEIHASS
jgi:nicotinate-nucleotide adenylyltransferase